MMRSGVLVVGAGGHASVVLDALLANGTRVTALVDDLEARKGQTMQGIPILRPDEVEGPASLGWVHAVGDNVTRAEMASRFPGPWLKVVHPAAIVSDTASIGEGACVLAGSIVQSNALVEPGVILNSGSIVEHDVVVGEFSHLAPRSVVLGAGRVGPFSLVGAGAVILPGVQVGSSCIVGAGAVVTNNLPDGTVAVGVPAKPVETP